MGRLILLKESKIEIRPRKSKVANKKLRYLRFGLFKCYCGKEFETVINYVKFGKTISCGCFRKDLLKAKIPKELLAMGDTIKDINPSEYKIWIGMKTRCYKSNTISYKNYGGRGIQVCDKWIDKDRGFFNFYNDLGKRPSLGYSLERIDVNGNYCPENCKWATRKEQSRNKRNSILITYNDKTQCLKDWSKETGIHYNTVFYRLFRGWPISKVFTHPIQSSQSRPIGK